MGDHQYSLSDLRQLVAGRTHFSGIPQITDPFFVQTSRNNNNYNSNNNILVPPYAHHHYHHHHHHRDSIIAAGSATAAAPAVAGHEVMLANSSLIKLPHDHYCNNNAAAATTTSSSGAPPTFFGLEMESGWINNGNDVGNNSRWPRQETLTLLEIRSRLDSRFKEANQKGPLWDEVSRIMAEEHGYQRSGKKCREKFENLYKYYKKTKEGKAGRQDGKHYRFFRQLEALYGETTTRSNQQLASASASDTHLVNSTTSATTTDFLYQTPSSRNNHLINQENQEPSSFQENKHGTESLSFSNTSEFETSSSENNDDDLSAIAIMMNRSVEKQKGSKKSWKVKVKDFVDLQMKKLLERQEVWMGRMLKTIEDREQERMCREEEWTKREMDRLDRIHEFWAQERAWIEARDVALMEALKKYTRCNNDNHHDKKTLELAKSAVEEIAIATETHYQNQDRNAKKIEIDIDEDENINYARWNEPEIFSLIQLRTAMESRFQESSGHSRERLWEEIAAKMSSLGYDRSMEEIKEKWENMNMYFNMTTTTTRECNKKRKEDLRTSNYFQQLDPCNNGQEIAKIESLNSPSSSSFVGSSHVHGSSSSSCFQVPINGGEDLWNKYGLQLMSSKEKNHHQQQL